MAHALGMALLLPTALHAQQTSDVQPYRPLPRFPYVLVSPYGVTVPPVVDDSLFHALAAGVLFPVNRSTLIPDDPFLLQLRDTLMPLLVRRQARLRRVLVRGAASPEGPYDNNRRLGRERTLRLADWLQDHAPASLLPDSLQTDFVTEDYGRLLQLMQAEADPDLEEVRRIWLSANGDERLCKRRLRALRQGEVWQRLYRTYFPRLRRAGVLFWVSEPPQLASLTAAPLPTAGARPYEPLPSLPAPVASPDEAVEYERRHLLAVRTNLLHDFFYMPGFGWAPSANIQLEYYPLGGHYTYNMGFTFSNHRHWSSQEFFQVRDVQLELRRYFRGGGRFLGAFLNAYAEGAVYGFGLSDTKGWEGEGGGAGLGCGYSMRLNRKGSLRLELTFDVGVFITRYDPYVYGNPITGDRDGDYYYDYKGNASSFKKRNHRFTWVGPTNAGIHLTYDIVYRKKRPVGYYARKGGLK